MAIDVGTYGSKGYRRFPAAGKAVLPPVEEFFSALFDKTSLQEWEDTFSSVGLACLYYLWCHKPLLVV